MVRCLGPGRLIWGIPDERGRNLTDVQHRVAIVGCGWMGEYYVEAYSGYSDTEIVGIVESNPERRRAVAERFGVKAAYADVEALLRDTVPDVVSVVTPTSYFKEVVIACAEAGVKGISVEKPIGGVLSDVDEMVDACESRGVVFAGGRVQRAIKEVQQAASGIRAGKYGRIVGASVHNWGGGREISGGGNQHVSVLRLLADAEVREVIAWGKPAEALASDSDVGLVVNGLFSLTNGIECPVYGVDTPYGGFDGGVQVWSDVSLIRAESFASPEIFRGFDDEGARVRVDTPWETGENQTGALEGLLRSFLASVATGSELWVSAHDLRQALEVAIAAKRSALLGSVPVKLPLEDRSLSLYPTRERWLGKDAAA